MELSLQTPALLFPALTLIMLAYTNRFLALGTLIRTIYKEYQEKQEEKHLHQIQNLQHRLRLIRDMQVLGVLSLTSCVLCMALIYLRFQMAAHWVFGGSLVLLAGSLILSVYEIIISTRALHIQLGDLEGKSQGKTLY